MAGSRSCATVRWCWPCRKAKWGRAHTALFMLAAGELDRIRLAQAGTDSMFGNVAMFVASLPFHPLELENRPVKVWVGR